LPSKAWPKVKKFALEKEGTLVFLKTKKKARKVGKKKRGGGQFLWLSFWYTGRKKPLKSEIRGGFRGRGDIKSLKSLREKDCQREGGLRN